MEIISIILHTNDQKWAKAFETYLRKTPEAGMRIDLRQPENIKTEEENPGTVRLIDLETTEINYSSMEQSLFLVKEPPKDEGGQKIYKYAPADRIVRRIQMAAGKKFSPKEVSHFLFASGITSSISWRKCTALARALREKGKQVLVVSFAHYDTTNPWPREAMADPFGRFAYYSGQSTERLALYLESLCYKNGQGYWWIPKPYLFETEQWKEQASENAIEALSNQSFFNAVLWHIDGLYSQGLIPLYEKSDRIFWTSAHKMGQKDLTLETLSRIAKKELTLKTQWFYEQGDKQISYSEQEDESWVEAWS